MLLADMVVLLWSYVSHSNLFLMISIADVTEMAVNRAKTSFSFFQSGLLHVICKFFGVVDMVDGINSQEF